MDATKEQLITAYKRLNMPLTPELAAYEAEKAAAPPAPVTPAPAVQIAQAILQPPVNPWMVLWPIVQKALKPEDLGWIKAHVAEGAPGFLQFLDSQTLQSLLQIANEEYRSFLRGDAK